ncbi:MAG: Gfo/Idh/MocA family oxidoreductase [Planctomycetes bacterium]|nr:Gfo/Idh/MocA family oxidoreductase [Planctomycetota bacterium]
MKADNIAARRLSRRQFIKKTTGLVGAPFIVPSAVLGLGGAPPPSERVAIGCIGTGRRGQHNIEGLMHYGARIVALCDVKPSMREEAMALAKLTAKDAASDFRAVLDRKDVDAVMIATPDHWHVLIGIAAIRAGKDVYLEKPLGITIAEGKAMRKAVLESNRVFMHGTEQRGMPDVRQVCEAVRNGRIGKLHTITVACPGGQEIPPQPEMPVPAGFDYDRWLGPARLAPYTEKRVTPPYFFFISDYAPSGFVCGWGVHHLDVAQWGNGTDPTGPVEIEGRGTYPKEGLADTALTWKIEYRYENGVKLIFTDTSQNPEGVRFEGTGGWIFKAYRKPAQASNPDILKAEIRSGEIRLYETDADDHCFIECVKSRKETCSPIEVAHRSTIIGYLGDIAMRLGRKLRWDPAKEQFVNDPEANRWLSREMRAPWHL